MHAATHPLSSGPCTVLTNYRRGVLAEQAAALYLERKKHKVLARRFRSPAGEIDLITQKGNDYFFVEVKKRANYRQGLEAITPKQQARIANSAEGWLANNAQQTQGECHLSAIIVTPRDIHFLQDL